MFFAYLFYAPKALISFVGSFLTFVLSWFIAFFVVYAEENTVTGYPSQFPGKLRAHIAPPFRLCTTFDDCADPMWYTGRMKDFSIFGWKPFRNLTDADYEAQTWPGAWYRYVARVLWLQRNPAYGLSLALGYDQRGLQIDKIQDEQDLWDKGYPNTSKWVFTNVWGHKGFLYQRQKRLFGQVFLEIVLGYKVPWAGQRKAMIAERITIKHYPKLPV